MNGDLRTLIAVHVPKTAGTTFREALARAYGAGLRVDKGDAPMSQPRWARRTSALRQAAANAGRTSPDACICGHFMPLKYAMLRRTRFSVWLRDPVQRVLSRYHHYLRRADIETAHWRWGLRPGLSLEQFVRVPQYQNTYAEYFWLFPLRRFDFIGIVEEYDTELERFARTFGVTADLRGEARNRNPDKAAPLYQVEPATERLIRACNARDVALYERARQA